MSPELTFRGRRVLLVAHRPRHRRDRARAAARRRPRDRRRSRRPTLPHLAARPRRARAGHAGRTSADPTAYDVVLRGDPSTVTRRRPRAAVADGDPSVGTVTLLGGGLGDPGLLTVAGLEAIRTADVIVHDRLAPLERAASRPATTSRHRRRQDPARRLHTRRNASTTSSSSTRSPGETSCGSRAATTSSSVAAARRPRPARRRGIPVVVIPGVSSSIAAPALAGIPVTHRSLVQGFTVVSGARAARRPAQHARLGRHRPQPTRRSSCSWGWRPSAPSPTSPRRRRACRRTTPAAVVADAGLPSMRSVRAPLSRDRCRRPVARASAPLPSSSSATLRRSTCSR